MYIHTLMFLVLTPFFPGIAAWINKIQISQSRTYLWILFYMYCSQKVPPPTHSHPNHSYHNTFLYQTGQASRPTCIKHPCCWHERWNIVRYIWLTGLFNILWWLRRDTGSNSPHSQFIRFSVPSGFFIGLATNPCMNLGTIYSQVGIN